MLGSTERFSNRVENYVRYRPDYPAAVIDLLRTKCGLEPTSIVADVGSSNGTFVNDKAINVATELRDLLVELQGLPVFKRRAKT